MGAKRIVVGRESIGKWRGTHVRALAIVEADVRVITAHMHERSANARIYSVGGSFMLADPSAARAHV